MAKPVQGRRCPATVSGPMLATSVVREPGRPAESRCHDPRVKGNGITMNPGVRRPIPRSPIPLIVPGLLLAMLLAACASPGASEPALPGGSGQASADASPATEPSASAAFPVTITDDTGTNLTLSEEPAAIVSLAPSNTEIVCALDACDRLVGVTDFDDYPPEVADVTDVVVQTQVDVELVVDAEPDLVLAAGNELTPSAVIEQLDELGLTVLVLYPESLDEVYADIELIGEALGARAVADAVVADM